MLVTTTATTVGLAASTAPALWGQIVRIGCGRRYCTCSSGYPTCHTDGYCWARFSWENRCPGTCTASYSVATCPCLGSNRLCYAYHCAGICQNTPCCSTQLSGSCTISQVNNIVECSVYGCFHQCPGCPGGTSPSPPPPSTSSPTAITSGTTPTPAPTVADPCDAVRNTCATQTCAGNVITTNYCSISGGVLVEECDCTSQSSINAEASPVTSEGGSSSSSSSVGLIAGVGGGVVAIVGIGAALYLMKMRATKVEQSPQTAH